MIDFERSFMVNKVILVGNLGKDPEMKYLPSGQALCNFSLATTESWTKDGNRETRTEWHRITTFGKLAEICGEYLTKGKQVYIEGKLQTREWEDKDGNKRYTTEIVAKDMKMLGHKDDKPSAKASAPPSKPQYKSEPPPADDDDSDIPF